MVIDTTMAPMLTVREVAKILHVHPNTVRRWSDRGMLRATRITHRGDRRFQKQDVSIFLAELHKHNGNEKEIMQAW
jgi:excisionase family DNA binding protein